MKFGKIQFLILGLLIAFFGCKSKQALIVYGDTKIETTQIKIDSVMLFEKTSSGSGFFRLLNDSIYYYDDLFMTCCIYDLNGKFGRRILGKGDSANEVRKFSYEGYSPTIGHIFFGNNYQFNRFTVDWKKESPPYLFNWAHRKRKYATQDLADINMYDFNHENSPFDEKRLNILSNGKGVIPIMVTIHGNELTNWFINPVNYYKNAYSVGLIDLKTGRLERGFAKRPDIYAERKIPLLDYVYIGVKTDSILLSYKADSLIYVYDKNQQLKYAFGRSSADVNTEFETIESIEDFNKRKKVSERKYGWYQSLFVDSVSNILFRSYIRCQNCSTSGLQVYRGKTLIADLVVPKRFNIIGKSGEYYYADGIIDEKSDQLGFFKFKLFE